MSLKNPNISRVCCALSLTALFVLLNGCDNSKIVNKAPKIDCSNETGVSSIIATLKDNGEKSIKNERNDLSLSSIRASLSTLNMNAQNIRTSKVDPNSTKVFCEAEVVISPPIHLINDANTSLKASDEMSIKDISILLENIGLNPSRNSANSFEATINYSLQPTDDGQTIVSIIENGDTQLILGIKDLILWSMTKTSLMNATTEANAITHEEARAAQNKQAEPNIANAAIDSASVITEYASQKAYLECSIGNTVASKPCLVSEEEAIANTPLTVKHFGENGRYRLITIVWPDKDVSRYAVIDGEQLINLRKPNSGHYHLDYRRNGQVILNDGVNIMRDGNPYISLWK